MYTSTGDVDDGKLDIDSSLPLLCRPPFSCGSPSSACRCLPASAIGCFSRFEQELNEQTDTRSTDDGAELLGTRREPTDERSVLRLDSRPSVELSWLGLRPDLGKGEIA